MAMEQQHLFFDFACRSICFWLVGNDCRLSLCRVFEVWPLEKHADLRNNDEEVSEVDRSKALCLILTYHMLNNSGGEDLRMRIVL
jgi:hypothetical protein